MLVDYAAYRSSLLDARAGLHAIGFELSRDEQYAYRFKHPDGRKLDLIVADHLPSRMEPRLDRRPAFAAPSGEQAIRRRDIYQLTFADGGTVSLGVPDELGALVAKGAAWLVDRRDRERHLDDGAVLFASVEDVSEIDYPGMSKNDRKRIRALFEQLSDAAHPSWMRLGRADRERGLVNMKLIHRAISLT
ncbi:MAG: hypothetical protein LBM23_06705 [Propionibacteriaceae bacterium]|nr:hypothetical protein [Propionibacteriaceae bacterium]